ncbi:dipeptidase [Bacillus sp. H-16]|uniref:dipeptidase n=1 Tax=Alteribacter salitolerans TaxID=2912333 RepID=UPI001963447C|nr:dipeptidase [Alteribacter salitolerans]MBM7094548.1 dipeptidase [Alteribacter salitolerans]
MHVFDLHCDALLKLWEDRSKSYLNDANIHTSFERLQKGNVKLQLFAVFVEPEIPSDMKFQVALEQIDLFYYKVLAQKGIRHIRNWSDLRQLKPDETGAMLTLEGADAFGNDLMKLRTLYNLGVKSLGLTWNNANLCADGVGEPRNGGLTELGFEVVRLNNQFRIWTDVSHLTEPGFWDVMKTADYPVATHSNAKTLCSHRRNLTDEQAQALFKKKGLLGVVFHPPFLVDDAETAEISDLLRHIEHFCELGGKNHLSFGSDFDGIQFFVSDLDHSGLYQNLINELLKYYSEQDVRGFAYQNVLDHLPE